MGYDLIFHTHVEADVSEAYNWYEDREVGLGERFLTELTISYKKLQDYPELFSKASKYYRKLIINYFPYLIAYEIDQNRVTVYAVFHTSQNPKEILKRKK